MESRLNIFALPNQTTIVFSLMVIVILGTVFLGSIGWSPMPILPIAVGLVLLSWRAFLARPEKEMLQYDLQFAGEDFAPLQQAITACAEEIGLRRIPKLMVGNMKTPLYTFGTFRRWYIALSPELGRKLQIELTQPDSAPAAHSVLIHELYHFKTGDYWQLGYVRELLRVTVLFTAWAAVFWTGLMWITFLEAPQVLNIRELPDRLTLLTPEMRQSILAMLPTEQKLQEIREQSAGASLNLIASFSINSMLSLILVAGILWAFYWPKLWRTRESYADAGPIHLQQEVAPYLSALTQIPLPTLRRYPQIFSNQPTLEGDQAIGMRWRFNLRSLLTRHEDAGKRISHIIRPYEVYGQWYDTTIMVGTLVLLFENLVAGPLTLIIVGQWPMHFITLVVFVTVSLRLLPDLALGRSVGTKMLKTVLVIMGARLCFVLFIFASMTIIFFISPTLLDIVLAEIVAITADITRFSPALFFEDLASFLMISFVMHVAQIFIVLLILVSSLTGVIWLFRRQFTWYSFPQAEKRLMKTAYYVIGAITLFLTLTVLPLATAVLLDHQLLVDPLFISSILCGFFIGIVGLGWFFYNDRRYARRCSRCHAVVAGDFRLGMCCSTPDCQERLHSWLIAEYKI